MGFHKTSIDSIIIVGAIALEPDEQSMFRYTKTKREFLYDIELAFLQMNLDFIIDIPPNEEFTIENIKLQKTIYFDGLSKDHFFDIISSITTARLVYRSNDS